MSKPSLPFRETEILELGRALRTSRVVVLTGPPGIGKSAIAGAWAAATATVVCSLEAARGPGDVLGVIARALEVERRADADIATLGDRIQRALATRSERVIVLDDVDRCRPALTKLLRRWLERPGPTFLVTARGRLGLAGEHLLDIGPLDVPARSENDPGRIAANPAVQLFARQAATVRAGFRITPANARVVARIVRELEGVPLAVELCASRARVLSEKEIAELLAERLDLLEDERGERSIRSAFALSWDELDEDAAYLLAACSCFRGGFQLEAACAVALEKRPASPKEKLRIARTLERLVEGALVRVTGTDDQRYVVPETLRVFAAEKLTALHASTLIHDRHANYYAGLSSQKRALKEIALEYKNLERAYDRSIRNGDPRAAAALLSYAPVSLAQGPLAPFVDRATRVLTETKPRSVDRIDLLYARGVARLFQGKRDDAIEDFARARTLALRAKALRPLALATSRIAMIKGLKGEVEVALRLFVEAQEWAGKAGDPLVSGIVLKDHANVLAEASRNEEAIATFGRARKFLRAAKDEREEGVVLTMLGGRHFDDGDLVAARRELVAALELLRRTGDIRTEAWALTMLALVDAEAGATSQGRTHIERALVLIREVGDDHTEGLALGYLGNIALEQGLLADAENAYDEAITRLAKAGDHATEGFFTATAAVVDHLLGRDAEARAGFDTARKLVVNDARVARREAVALLASVVAKTKAVVPRGPAFDEIRFARRVLASVSKRTEAPVAREEGIVVAHDGSWLRTSDGVIAKLGKGRPSAKIMARLALERVRHPGQPLSVATLVRAGWPDERILPDAAKNRVHVTIARMRRAANLQDALRSEDDGYFIDPEMSMRIADPNERAIQAPGRSSM